MTLKIIDNDNSGDKELHNIELIKLSASSMKTFDQCPRKYYFTYIDKQPRKEYDHFFLGNLCHRALEIFHETYMKDGLKGKTLNKLMSFSFAEAKKEEEFENLNPKIVEEAKELLMDYLKYVSENSMPMVKGVEIPFNFKVGDNILIRGFIDRLDILKDGTFEIVDYKTTKNVKYLEPFQLLIYGLWLKEEYKDLNKFKASYVLLRHGSKPKAYDFNLEDLKKVEKEIISYANKIKTENQWVPVPTGLCNWCDFKEICPAHKAW
jgi:putative RecB family exonuclease